MLYIWYPRKGVETLKIGRWGYQTTPPDVQSPQTRNRFPTLKGQKSSPPLPEPLSLLPQRCEPFLAFPTVPLRGFAGRCSCVLCHRWACRPPDVCCSEEIENRPAAPLVGERLRAAPALGWARERSSLLQDGRPEGLLLAFPLRAVLEQMLTSLDRILASKAGVQSTQGTVLPVPRLELVEAGGKALCWHAPPSAASAFHWGRGTCGSCTEPLLGPALVLLRQTRA